MHTTGAFIGDELTEIVYAPGTGAASISVASIKGSKRAVRTSILVETAKKSIAEETRRACQLYRDIPPHLDLYGSWGA